MRKTKEILRLHYELGLSRREIARSLSISHSTVGDLLKRAEALGLTWPLPADLDEAALEMRLYSRRPGSSACRPEPDCEKSTAS